MTSTRWTATPQFIIPYKTANDAPEGFVSSYSTYDNSGLPAGPICNPGLEAIKAAIYPSEEGSEYYFFCHDSDGTPYYASTMDEHLMNMAEARPAVTDTTFTITKLPVPFRRILSGKAQMQ